MAKGDKRPVVMDAEKGQAGGVATLDGSKRLVREQTPLHSAQHGTGGSDPVRPCDIGARGQRNLLDNGYFVDPVNQRGKSVYTGTGYTIDRWTLWEVRNSNYNHTLRVEAGGVAIESNSPNGAGVVLEQKLEKPLTGQYTFSMLVDEVSGDLHVECGGHFNVSQPGLFTATVQADGMDNVRMYASSSGAFRCKLRAVKLEPGGAQTLARQTVSGSWVLNDPAPDKTLETLKCQRYFQVFRSSNWRPPTGRDYRPSMRLNTPTTGTMTLSDGTVVYTASAEL